jgi:hypothetical protein
MASQALVPLLIAIGNPGHGISGEMELALNSNPQSTKW